MNNLLNSSGFKGFTRLPRGFNLVSSWFQAGFKGFMHLPRISMHQVREIARLPRIVPRLPRIFATPANDSRCFLLVRVAMTFYEFLSQNSNACKVFRHGPT